MIEAEIEIQQLEILDKYNKKIGSAEAKLRGLSIYATQDLIFRTKFYLTEILGEKMRLFYVDVIPAGFVTNVVIGSIDKKGALYFHGSPRHSYSSARPMPIATGVFAYRVNHPGFKGKKKEMQKAMKKATRETRQHIQKILRQGFISD